MVVVISFGPVVGDCHFLLLLDGCSYFLEAVGHTGHVHAERAKGDHKRNGLEPSNTAA